MTRLRAGVAVAALALLALVALLLGLRTTSALPFSPVFEASVSDPAVSVNADLSLRTVVGAGEHLPLFATFTFPAGSFDFAFDADIPNNTEDVGDGTMIVDRDCNGNADSFQFTIEEIGTEETDEKTRYLTQSIPFMQMTLILKGDLASGHTIEVVMFTGAETPCLQPPLDLTFNINGLSSPGNLAVVTNPSSPGAYTLSGAYNPSPTLVHPEEGDQCANAIDDDNDGAVNDGCPAVSASETDAFCTDTVNDDPADDALINDGCPANGAAETDCSDTTTTGLPLDDDADGSPNDGCPQAGFTAESACTNAIDDDGDGDVNDGCPTVIGPAINSEDDVCIGPCATPTPSPTPTSTPPPTPCPDFNDDGVVNSLDAFLLASRFGSTTGFTPSGRLPYLPLYDLNADGAINIQDVYVFALDFNTACA